MKKAWIWNALFFLIGLFLFWLAFRGQNFSEIRAQLVNVHSGWLTASIVTSVLAHYVRALRWNLLLEPYGYRPGLRSVSALMMGYLANLAVPRLGEVVRCTVLKKKAGVPVPFAIGTVLTERILDLLVMVLLIILVLFTQAPLKEPLSGIINGLFGKSTLIVLPLILLGMVLSLWAGYHIIKKWAPDTIRDWMKQKWQGLYSGMLSIGQLDQKVLFLAYTVFIWFGYGLAAWFGFLALSGTAHLGAGPVLGVLTFSSLGMSAPVQGGIGAYHYMVRLCLELYEVPRSVGLAYAFLSHGVQTLLILVLTPCLVLLTTFLYPSGGQQKVN